MLLQQVLLAVPTQCPSCSVHRWARLYAHQRGATIALEWECTACERRWPVANRDFLTAPHNASVSSTRGLALVEQIAGLREVNEDLRASALRWQQLYENAIRRCAERDGEVTAVSSFEAPPDEGG